MTIPTVGGDTTALDSSGWPEPYLHIDAVGKDVPGRWQPVLCGAPERFHGVRLTDDHPRPRANSESRKGLTALPGGNEIRAAVAQGRDRSRGVLDRSEAPIPAARRVLEEHALDRLGRAELQHPITGRLENRHSSILL